MRRPWRRRRTPTGDTGPATIYPHRGGATAGREWQDIVDDPAVSWWRARAVVLAHLRGPCLQCTSDGCPEAQAALAYVLARRPPTG